MIWQHKSGLNSNQQAQQIHEQNIQNESHKWNTTEKELTHSQVRSNTDEIETKWFRSC